MGFRENAQEAANRTIRRAISLSCEGKAVAPGDTSGKAEA